MLEGEGGEADSGPERMSSKEGLRGGYGRRTYLCRSVMLSECCWLTFRAAPCCIHAADIIFL